MTPILPCQGLCGRTSRSTASHPLGVSRSVRNARSNLLSCAFQGLFPYFLAYVQLTDEMHDCCESSPGLSLSPCTKAPELTRLRNPLHRASASLLLKSAPLPTCKRGRSSPRIDLYQGVYMLAMSIDIRSRFPFRSFPSMSTTLRHLGTSTLSTWRGLSAFYLEIGPCKTVQPLFILFNLPTHISDSRERHSL
jgi:hypothetical protein